MVKKFFLLLLVAMLNVMAWAEGPELRITHNDPSWDKDNEKYEVQVGYTKFNEPTVVVRDGGTNLTDQYNITYSIYGGTGYGTEGTSTTNSRGTAIKSDVTTSSTVEINGGGFIAGNSAGSVKISITATPTFTGGTTLTGEYYVDVEGIAAVINFNPAFKEPTTTETGEGYTGSMKLATKQVGWWYYKTAAVLPSYKITNTTSGGLVEDITDKYTVNITFTPDENNLLKINNEKTKIYFDQGTSVAGNKSGTLTYSFTPVSGYYSAIADKKIHVTLDVLSEKATLALSYTRDDFTQETVNHSTTSVTEEGTDPYYTIHIYKWSDEGDYGKRYHWNTPRPTLHLSGENAALPTVDDGTDVWGGFKFMYQIVEGEDKTYFDDCQYDYKTHTGTIQVAGETGVLGSISNTYFQTDKPGLVKVAVYAVLDGAYDNYDYGANYKQIYEPYKEDGVNPKTFTQWGYTYTAYTAPQYFYIDVMKRRPTIVMDPDPESLVFLTGDQVTMDTRFDISAHIDDSHNGTEENLIFSDAVGANNFVYTFFLSDRMKNDYIDLYWPNTGHSYTDWFKTGSSGVSSAKPIQAGDLIKIGTMQVTTGSEAFYIETEDKKLTSDNVIFGTDVTINGQSVTVSPGNIDQLSYIPANTTVTINKYALVTGDDITNNTYSVNHPNLLDGDYERGTTYQSQKGWGNESWKITFKTVGTYKIPYTTHEWTHTKWDHSDATTIDYEVKATTPTEIKLEYYFTNASVNQDPFAEPWAKVYTQGSEKDVTSHFTLSYSMDNDGGTGTTINATTGEVHIGSTTGTVRIKVSAARESLSEPYEDPTPVYYTIRILDYAGAATWEIVSTDATATHTACAEGNRFDFDDTSEHGERDQALGRMHYLTAGVIYGGDRITGAPGMEMVIGNGDAEVDEWSTVAAPEYTTKCCSHETSETSTVVAVSSKNVVLDENGIPTEGAFYVFKPSVNGFLYADGYFQSGHKVTLISEDGTYEQIDVAANNAGEQFFSKALIAGKTYYLYDTTAPLRLHGFRYQPAFIFDRNTTKAQSEHPIEATTFTNSLSNGVPVLHGGANPVVDYTVVDYVPKDVTVANYLRFTTEHTGALNPQAMTIKDNAIFQLRVNAEVGSTEEDKWGTSVNKNTYYHISILDIPRYVVTKDMTAPNVGTKVSTENIKTDIVMTYGGWNDTDGGYVYDKDYEDKYEYKDNNQVMADAKHEHDAEYSRVIDSPFEYYLTGNNNPLDEDNQEPLIEEGGYRYQYVSGATYEQDNGDLYNTTYRLPCRGAYYKFEPRESGTLIVYLCQNGASDVYDNGSTKTSASDGDYPNGMPKTDIQDKERYQAKWRPLYITDEKGKPVTMVNSFGNVSQFFTSNDDIENSGSFTSGLSRCDIDDPIVRSAWDWDASKSYGTSFDWSAFRGTDEDRAKIIAAWPKRGEPISIVRLSNGGFSLAHKANVRYAFEVKAGKTYFVFQYHSKPLLSGFAFVPEGFPDKCKYTLDSTPASYEFNAENQEKNWSGTAATSEVDYETGTHTTYDAADPIKGAQSHITDNSVLSGSDYQEPAGRDIHFTWDTSSTRFTEDKENLVVTINDRRNSELTSSAAAYTENKTKIKPRTFAAGIWESICLPFSVSEQEMTRVFGSGYELVTSEGVVSDENPELKFVRHAHAYIEAGRPYFIKPKQPGIFSFRNVTIEGDQLAMEGSSTRVTDLTRFNVNVNREEYIFKGTYMRETMPEGSFFMYAGDNEHENGLYRYTTASKIGGYRAYFNYPGGSKTNPNSVSNAVFFEFKIEDRTKMTALPDEDPTEVIAISSDGSYDIMPKNAGIYTVDGQKVSDNPLDFNTLPSGLYVINGKKYIK